MADEAATIMVALSALLHWSHDAEGLTPVVRDLMRERVVEARRALDAMRSRLDVVTRQREDANKTGDHLGVQLRQALAQRDDALAMDREHMASFRAELDEERANAETLRQTVCDLNDGCVAYEKRIAELTAALDAALGWKSNALEAAASRDAIRVKFDEVEAENNALRDALAASRAETERVRAALRSREEWVHGRHGEQLTLPHPGCPHCAALDAAAEVPRG